MILLCCDLHLARAFFLHSSAFVYVAFVYLLALKMCLKAISLCVGIKDLPENYLLVYISATLSSVKLEPLILSFFFISGEFRAPSTCP